MAERETRSELVELSDAHSDRLWQWKEQSLKAFGRRLRDNSKYQAETSGGRHQHGSDQDQGSNAEESSLKATLAKMGLLNSKHH